MLTGGPVKVSSHFTSCMDTKGQSLTLVENGARVLHFCYGKVHTPHLCMLMSKKQQGKYTQLACPVHVLFAGIPKQEQNGKEGMTLCIHNDSTGGGLSSVKHHSN